MANVLAGEVVSSPEPKTKRSISPPAISASMAVITFVLTAGWYTVLYIQNWERDRATASMNACRDFAFGEGLKASDKFNEVSKYVAGNAYTNRPFTKGIPGRKGDDEQVRNSLLTLVNMIDVTATGLDTGVYEPKIIASCLSQNFSVVTEALSQPTDSFVTMAGHERIPVWSERLQTLAKIPPEQNAFWKLF